MSMVCAAPAGRLVIAASLALAAFFIHTAEAAYYYVDAQLGQDSYSGQSAAPQGSPASDGPWRTLARVAAQTLAPGDAVYLRCGQTWRGTLTLSNSGSAALPINVSRYGENCDGSNNPIITAGETIPNWTHQGGDIYVANTYFPIRQLFVDGERMQLAQHPNQGFDPGNPDNVYLTTDIDAISGLKYSDRFKDYDLVLGPEQNIVGAGIHVRVNDWTISDRHVADYDPTTSTITLDVPNKNHRSRMGLLSRQ